MKPIGTDEIKNLKYAIQYFQDCYLVSSIGALSHSANGRKILSENIAHTKDGFRIRFRNINQNSEDFFVTQKEMDDLIYMDKFLNPIPINKYFPHNPIIKAIEVAMNKLLSHYPSKKPWICRFPNCNEKFEYNKPSNFLEMFTGKPPLKLNEGSFRMTLKSKRKESTALFDKIKNDNNCSFVAGTAFSTNKNFSDYHCYSLKEITKNNMLGLFDHRLSGSNYLTYDEAIKKLKFIVGYFNKDLI